MPHSKAFFPSAILGTRSVGSSAGAVQPAMKAHKESVGTAVLFIFLMLYVDLPCNSLIHTNFTTN